jgi:hypothetical protein
VYTPTLLRTARRGSVLPLCSLVRSNARLSRYQYYVFYPIDNRTMAEGPFSLDKSAFSVSSFSEAESKDKAHWLSKTPKERLAALERMRQINYAYDPVSDRIQRTVDVARRS